MGGRDFRCGARWAPRRRPRPVEAGFTLVEMLVAVAIMGLAVVGFAGAMGTIVAISDFERREAVAETEVRRFAEAVRSGGYSPCDDPATGSYQAYFDAVQHDPGATGAVDGIEFWAKHDPTDRADDEFLRLSEYRDDAGYCDGGAPDGDPRQADEGLQRVTLRVDVAGSPVASATLTVAKRRAG